MLDINPFNNICFAVNRGKDLKNIPRFIAPHTPKAITVEYCVYVYTINGSKQLGLEKRNRAMIKGKSADFVDFKVGYTKYAY